MKHAGTKQEISCLIGHIFQEIEPPCSSCKTGQKEIVLKGIKENGEEAIMHIEDGEIFYFEGVSEEEIQEIRQVKCYGSFKRR